MPLLKAALLKWILSLLFFVNCSVIVFAQNVIQPDTTQFFRLYTGSVPIDVQFKSPLTNLSLDTISMRWTVEKGPNWPVDWDVFVADQNLTFVPSISTSPVPTEILPEDSAVHFLSGVFFNGTAGCATYQVILSDYNQDSIVFDTINYVLNVNDPNCGLTTIELGPQIDFQVYPNPVYDQFRLQSSTSYRELKCYDMLGRELLSWSKTSSGVYDLSSLLPGHYWLRIESKEGRFATYKIEKR